VAEQPEPLLSDAERDAVVERLRAACGEGRLSLEEFSDRVSDVYRARTATDLVPLTHDLPAEPEPDGPTLRPTEWVVAVFSGSGRSGPWRPARPTRAVAVFGGCQLDLTAVDLDAETHLVAVAVFGGVEVLVPEGVMVDLGGFAVFGGREDRTSSHAKPGGPVVRIDCRAFFGGVTVRTPRFRGR
jgi:Domain of unknown function (DUF1707)